MKKLFLLCLFLLIRVFSAICDTGEICIAFKHGEGEIECEFVASNDAGEAAKQYGNRSLILYGQNVKPLFSSCATYFDYVKKILLLSGFNEKTIKHIISEASTSEDELQYVILDMKYIKEWKKTVRQYKDLQINSLEEAEKKIIDTYKGKIDTVAVSKEYQKILLLE